MEEKINNVTKHGHERNSLLTAAGFGSTRYSRFTGRICRRVHTARLHFVAHSNLFIKISRSLPKQSILRIFLRWISRKVVLAPDFSEVDPNEPESLRVSSRPLKVVHQ